MQYKPFYHYQAIDDQFLPSTIFPNPDPFPNKKNIEYNLQTNKKNLMFTSVVSSLDKSNTQ